MISVRGVSPAALPIWPRLVAVRADPVGCGVRGTGRAAAVQHHDGGLGAAERGLLGRRGLGGSANAGRAGDGGGLAQVARERVAEERRARSRRERSSSIVGDGADGDRRPAPGPDRVEIRSCACCIARSEFVLRAPLLQARSSAVPSRSVTTPEPSFLDMPARASDGDCPRHVPARQVARRTATLTGWVSRICDFFHTRLARVSSARCQAAHMFDGRQRAAGPEKALRVSGLCGLFSKA